MGMLYRKQYTMPIPKGAEIVERDGKRIARWRLRNGQQRTAEVVEESGDRHSDTPQSNPGLLRVRGQSKLYMARYRDGRDQIVEVATGCKDEIAARAVLAQLERRAELVRAGVMTEAEDSVADHVDVSLSKHVDAYVKHLRAKGGDPRRISMLRRRLERLFEDCRFSRLNKLSAGPIENWLVEQAENGLSASTRNNYREAAVCFGNWCRRTHRLTFNPFEDVPRANANADRRHHRRSLSTSELQKLLKVARWRPLAEYGREIVGRPMKAHCPSDEPISASHRVTADDTKSQRSPRSRATWNREPLVFDDLDQAVERARRSLKDNPELVAQLERVGQERALIYMTLALTGLRKGELASLTVGQLELDGKVAYAVLNAADEKNRKGSNIPLRADLAAELVEWMEEELSNLQNEARRAGKPIPVRLPPTTPMFNVPSGLTRIFDRDLAVAGISKRDDRNRVVDIHALRVTFGTHLCAAGVPLRTAQAAMRHSKPELTANIYTDPKLLDIAGAIDALPDLKLNPTPPFAPMAAGAHR